MSDDEDLDNPLADIDLVEIYAAGSHVGVDRICMILQDEEVEAIAREITLSELPSSANERFIVTVPASDAERATAIIKKAIDDAIVPNEGTFLGID
jgi:hypothetical protein